MGKKAFLSRFVLWTLYLVFLAGFLFLCHFYAYLHRPAGIDGSSLLITIDRGMGPRQIATELAKQGIIEEPKLFYLYCRWRRQTGKLQAGRYKLRPTMTPPQVLRYLSSGLITTVKVTVPEGLTLRQVATLLSNKGLASTDTFLTLAHDPAFLGSLGVSGPSLEGYLFPNTYEFKSGENPRKVLAMMVDAFKRHFDTDMKRQATTLGLTPFQVVILASLVEKEAMVDRERPMVAAVFLNRLKKGMPLQSDPTTIYDGDDAQGPVTREAIKRSSPYNTYRHKGLPPGPICSPGLASITAVLHPAQVPYLYFVSNNDGTHTFPEPFVNTSKPFSAIASKGGTERGIQRPNGLCPLTVRRVDVLSWPTKG